MTSPKLGEINLVVLDIWCAFRVIKVIKLSDESIYNYWQWDILYSLKEEVRSLDTWVLRKAFILLNTRKLFITWFRPSSAAGTPCVLQVFAIQVQPDVREKTGLFALVKDLNSRKSNCCSCCIGLDTRSYSNEVKVELPSIPVGSFAKTWLDLFCGQNWLGF